MWTVSGLASRVWLAIHSSFWFVPALVASALSLLAWATLSIDNAQLGLFALQFGVDGARSVLSTIAGGMMTVASIVISLTFVALTTLSSQLGPRILLFFMQDRPTQFVLGAFIGAFLYALIALLASGDGDGGAPVAAVIGAVTLAVATFGLMMYYVHHVAASIQADVLVARLGAQLVEAIDRLARHAAEGDVDPETARRDFGLEAGADTTVIHAPTTGYVEFVETARLAEIVRQNEVSIETLVRPADFVVAGLPVMRIAGACDDKTIDAARAAFAYGPNRTPLQQAHFEFAALTEVAARALSPGVNDPYTAVSCVDRLAQGLVHASRKAVAGDVARRLGDGRGLVEKRHSYADYIDTAFAPIRQYARNDALTARRIAQSFETLEQLVAPPEERRMLREAATGFRDDLAAHMTSERDRNALLDILDAVIEALSKETPEPSGSTS